MSTDPVIEALCDEARREGLSLRQLARRYDIDPSQLSRALRGEAGLGRIVQERIFRKRPDLGERYARSLSEAVA